MAGERTCLDKTETAGRLTHEVRAAKFGITPGMNACRLLELPLEIRNQIYQYLYTKGQILVAKSGNVRRKPFWGQHEEPDDAVPPCRAHGAENNSDMVHVDLLRTCTRIHDEAAQVLYSLNTFDFRGDDARLDLLEFCSRLGRVSRESLRNLKFNFMKIHSLGGSEMQRLPKLSNLLVLNVTADPYLALSHMANFYYIHMWKGDNRVRVSVYHWALDERNFENEWNTSYELLTVQNEIIDRLRTWGWEMDVTILPCNNA